jgi:hypothetical protein
MSTDALRARGAASCGRRTRSERDSGARVRGAKPNVAACAESTLAEVAATQRQAKINAAVGTPRGRVCPGRVRQLDAAGERAAARSSGAACAHEQRTKARARRFARTLLPPPRVPRRICMWARTTLRLHQPSAQRRASGLRAARARARWSAHGRAGMARTRWTHVANRTRHLLHFAPRAAHTRAACAVQRPATLCPCARVSRRRAAPPRAPGCSIADGTNKSTRQNPNPKR